MIGAAYALSAVAMVLAWALTQRRAEHRPIAVLLTVGLVADILRRVLRSLYLGAAIERLGNSTPWTGWPYAAAVASHALFLSWPAALAGAAMVVFLGRRPWPIVLGYAAGVVAILVVHPIAGNGSLARALTAGTLVGLAAAIGCAATWYLRSKEPTSSAQATLALMVAGELASLAGAWRIGLFTSWHLSQVVYILTFAVLSVIQGGFLWQSRSS